MGCTPCPLLTGQVRLVRPPESAQPSHLFRQESLSPRWGVLERAVVAKVRQGLQASSQYIWSVHSAEAGLGHQDSQCMSREERA